MKKNKNKNMDVNQNTNSGNGKSVTIATPMYGGLCYGAHARSVLNLVFKLVSLGYNVQMTEVYNESLITRARDMLTAVFLDQKTDYLLFIDADVQFDVEGVLKMFEADVDMIGAAIPLKAISWEKVAKAALDGQTDLRPHASNHSFNLVDRTPRVIDRGLKHEVFNVATGLLLIKRHVFDAVKPLVREYRYNGAPFHNVNFGDNISNYWGTGFDENENVYLSEDYMFCHLWRSTGGKVWVAPWLVINHYGTYPFN